MKTLKDAYRILKKTDDSLFAPKGPNKAQLKRIKINFKNIEKVKNSAKKQIKELEIILKERIKYLKSFK